MEPGPGVSDIVKFRLLACDENPERRREGVKTAPTSQSPALCILIVALLPSRTRRVQR